MNVLEKILEEKELAAIKDLIEENEKCLNQCEGACGSIKNGVCNCDDGILVQAIRKIQDYLSVVTDTNVGRKNGWIPCNERLPNEEEFIKAYCRNIYAAEFIVMIKGATLPTTLYFKNGSWTDMEGNYYNVVAWQPLPEPYKGGKENE